MLAQYFFYGTGHQPSFPAISWEAAFVGTAGTYLQNNYVQAVLIVINTFCSQILIGLLIPLLVIFPFTATVMLPSMTKRNITFIPKEEVRGEVLLYERDNIMLTVVFTTICKYIMCHGIRVSCFSNGVFWFFHVFVTGFCYNVGSYYSLPPHDGLDYFRAETDF